MLYALVPGISPAIAGEPSEITQLACKGTLAFGDGLARAAHLHVNLATGTVSTPECRTYQQMSGFCHGFIHKAADHYVQFGRYSAHENTRLKVLMIRDGALAPYDRNAAVKDTREMLFLGRCEPRKKSRARKSRFTRLAPLTC
jgi:hypothetical protein